MRMINTTSTRLPYTDLGYGSIASDGQLDRYRRVRPGLRPARHGQQGIEYARREPPHEHLADPERGTDEPARVAQPDPVDRIGQLGHRYPFHPGHLRRVARRDRVLRAPPRQ